MRVVFQQIERVLNPQPFEQNRIFRQPLLATRRGARRRGNRRGQRQLANMPRMRQQQCRINAVRVEVHKGPPHQRPRECIYDATCIRAVRGWEPKEAALPGERLVDVHPKCTEGRQRRQHVRERGPAFPLRTPRADVQVQAVDVPPEVRGVYEEAVEA